MKQVGVSAGVGALVGAVLVVALVCCASRGRQSLPLFSTFAAFAAFRDDEDGGALELAERRRREAALGMFGSSLSSLPSSPAASSPPHRGVWTRLHAWIRLHLRIQRTPTTHYSPTLIETTVSRTVSRLAPTSTLSDNTPPAWKSMRADALSELRQTPSDPSKPPLRPRSSSASSEYSRVSDPAVSAEQQRRVHEI